MAPSLPLLLCCPSQHLRNVPQVLCFSQNLLFRFLQAASVLKLSVWAQWSDDYFMLGALAYKA